MAEIRTQQKKQSNGIRSKNEKKMFQFKDLKQAVYLLNWEDPMSRGKVDCKIAEDKKSELEGKTSALFFLENKYTKRKIRSKYDNKPQLAVSRTDHAITIYYNPISAAFKVLDTKASRTGPLGEGGK